MKVSALKGEQNSGKTTTLSLLRKIMVGKAGFTEDFSTLIDLHKGDFRVILERDGKKIGIVSQGDYAINVGDKVSVKSHLDYMKGQGCEVVVCACTTGETKRKIFDAIEDYAPQREYVHKRKSNRESEDEDNKCCAKTIFNMLQNMN